MVTSTSSDPESPGENLAIAFVNTQPGHQDAARDAIGTPQALAAWLTEARPPRRWAGESSAAQPPSLPSSRILWVEAIRLRPAIRRLFAAVSSGRAVPTDVIHGLNRVLRHGRWTAHLVERQGRLHVETTSTAPHTVGLLADVARAAAEVAATVDTSRLRECEAPTCTRWFVDTSKGGRRRWCSMASCGNREKAARYRTRHATD